MFEDDEEWVYTTQSSMESPLEENENLEQKVTQGNKGRRKKKKTFLILFLTLTFISASLFTSLYVLKTQNTSNSTTQTKSFQSEQKYTLTTETLLKTEEGTEPIRPLHVNQEKRTSLEDKTSNVQEKLEEFLELLGKTKKGTKTYENLDIGQYFIRLEKESNLGVLYDRDLESVVGFVGDGFRETELGILKEKYTELYTYKLGNKVILAFTELLTEESSHK